MTGYSGRNIGPASYKSVKTVGGGKESQRPMDRGRVNRMTLQCISIITGRSFLDCMYCIFQ